MWIVCSHWAVVDGPSLASCSRCRTPGLMITPPGAGPGEVSANPAAAVAASATPSVPVGWVESPLTERSHAPCQGGEGAPPAWLAFAPGGRRAPPAPRPGAPTLVAAPQ